MSIRYTLRHNIPSDKLAEEDVNDSSTWDLNLLRKHELAETDNHDIVYRKHDGEVVNWADAATQQANEILEEVQGISSDIDNQVTLVESRLAEIEEEAVTLTEEAEAANEAAQTALVQAELAVTESQASADSASWSSTRASEWASKTDGLVGDEDYSSKYYAQQSATSAQSASSDAAISQEVKERVITAETNAVNAQNSAIASANSASTSATTATTKAGEASTSATTATTKASEASVSATTATTKASEASASATSASNSATTATTKASEASASASSASQSATSASTSATNASASATSAQASADAAEQAREDIQAYYGLPVGYEYFTTNPNIPQGSLPLFGGEYSRETYSALWEWVQQQTGYLKTESDWQDLATANNGNVPYYSSGNGSTTFRVPSLKCWIKGANGTVAEVGSYLEAGLPNITGHIGWRKYAADGRPLSYRYTGAFYEGSDIDAPSSICVGQETNKSLTTVEFDASRSSSIYGNSTTVQPESIVGMWLVKAYGTIVDMGQIDEQQYIDDRIATCLPLTGGTMLGAIHYNGTNNRSFGIDLTSDTNGTNVDVGWDYADGDGAGLGLRSTEHTTESGAFNLYARNSTSGEKSLIGKPDGSLTWGGYNVITTKYQSVTTQYVSNSVVSQTQFARNYAWVSNGFLFVQINMDFNSGVTTSDVTTVGKLKNVNILSDIIDVAVEQNATFKPGLLCLYNNGSDVDIRVYTVVATGGGRYARWFTVPLR